MIEKWCYKMIKMERYKCQKWRGVKMIKNRSKMTPYKNIKK
jgi:hypothetical protein